MKLLKRLIKAWKLSKKELKAFELTDSQIEALPDAGDGKAVFIGEGSENDWKDQQKADKGFKGIFGL